MKIPDNETPGFSLSVLLYWECLVWKKRLSHKTYLKMITGLITQVDYEIGKLLFKERASEFVDGFDHR